MPRWRRATSPHDVQEPIEIDSGSQLKPQQVTTSANSSAHNRNHRWNRAAANAKVETMAADTEIAEVCTGAISFPHSKSSVPLGQGSSPAVYMDKLQQDASHTLLRPTERRNEDDSGSEMSLDDEGESMMVGMRDNTSEERPSLRKMYFSTLDDSFRAQGIDDTPSDTPDLGPGERQSVRSLSQLGIGSSNRAFLEQPTDLSPSSQIINPKEFSAAQNLDIGCSHQASPEIPISSDSTRSTTREPRAYQRNQRRAKKRAEARGEPRASTSNPPGCVVLIREDCRLHDNPSLHAAATSYSWVVPLYVHDDGDPSPWPVRGAGLWWRHESLKAFASSLRDLGSRIVYRKGNLVEQVVDVLIETRASALHYNLQLEPWHHRRDLEMEAMIRESSSNHLHVQGFTAMVMKFEPWEVRVRGPDKPHREREDPLPAITRKLGSPPNGWPWSLPLEALGYCRTGGRKIPRDFKQYDEKRQAALESGSANPKEDNWAYDMRLFWPMGEKAAMRRLDEWIKEAAWGCYFPPDLHPRDQTGGRFRADKCWTAIISPYLRFGDLSPRYVEWRCRQALPYECRYLFLKRVVWRDKAYSQLYRCPDSHSVSIRQHYEHEAWSGTRLQLRRWQRGETGFPLVDAAMRQLWKVGWMCNHLRHITAQFLIEHLDLSWKDGFAWFDYTLVDTDVAINAMMWQMGGHSGIGAWNFVMHPIYAGKKSRPRWKLCPKMASRIEASPY